MQRVLIGLLALTVIGYLCLVVTIFLFQRSIIYFPVPRAITAPESTMHLPVDGADLVITIRVHEGQKALIYFGGNSEDVSLNLENFAALFPDYALYLMSYRGYGGSTGRPTETANFADAAALYQSVKAKHPDITLMGRSLGSGVAVHLASQVPARHLILVTPYNSVLAVGAAQYWFIPAPKLLILDKYQSDQYAPAISTPTSILEAQHDVVIPHWSTERLLKSFAPGVASITVIKDRGHNDIQLDPQYNDTLKAILR